MTTAAVISSPYVSPLAGAVDPAQFGGKALRLAEMQCLGYSIPSAVVVTVRAFRRMLDENGLDKRIEALVRPLSKTDPKATAAAAARIEALVMGGDLPLCIAEDVVSASSFLLEGGPVVVRSSACGEDSEGAAFAGQLDSFLNVHTSEELIDALKRCWASYWSHRSIAYQLAREVQLNGMGVIIQCQVDASFSGVLFTNDLEQPATDQMIVEYVPGLGDELVSGRIRPTRLVISGDSWHFDQTAGSDFPSASLDATTIEQLADAGRTLAKHFDHPQDIEWSVDRTGKLHLVQSRPITAFAEKPATTVWSNANVNENFPEPVSPLLYSIAATGYYHYFRNLGRAFGISSDRIEAMEDPLRNIIGTHGGRIYYNLTNIHAVLQSAPCGGFLASAFNEFVGAGDTATYSDLPNWRSLRTGRLAEIRESIRIAVNGCRRLRQMEPQVTVFERLVDEFAADSHPERLHSLSWRELLELWQEFMRIRCNWTDAAMADAASMISYGLSQRLLGTEFQSEVDQTIANRLLTGLCNLVSGLPTERLWDLSRLVRQNPALEELLADQPSDNVWRRIETDDSFVDARCALHEFLDQWGFRCSGELMLTTPSYQENPAALLDLLRAYVSQEGESPGELLTRQRQNREQETERVLGILRKRRLQRFLPWPRKDFIARRLIGWMQRSVACRERARCKQALLYSRCRRLALTIGRAFVDRGFLSNRDNVFFLTWEEIESLLSGRSMFPHETGQLAVLRRTAHERLGALSPPDRIQLTPGQYWKEDGGDDAPPESESRMVMRGKGVSGGSIVGRAVVLTDPSQFDQVTSGDILVTRQTDPGWGPILFLVRGLVMERGGMLSHGAILAREYGIPTVVDLRNATRRVNDGDLIRVDGDRGVVELVDE